MVTRQMCLLLLLRIFQFFFFFFHYVSKSILLLKVKNKKNKKIGVRDFAILRNKKNISCGIYNFFKVHLLRVTKFITRGYKNKKFFVLEIWKFFSSVTKSNNACYSL